MSEPADGPAYVIMGNDFPDSVAFGKEAADAAVARLEAADRASKTQGNSVRVYWRAMRVPVVTG